mgnify:CR=1 FL=1
MSITQLIWQSLNNSLSPAAIETVSPGFITLKIALLLFWATRRFQVFSLGFLA